MKSKVLLLALASMLAGGAMAQDCTFFFPTTKGTKLVKKSYDSKGNLSGAGVCLWALSLPNRKWWRYQAKLTNGSSVRPVFIAPVITWMITMLSFPRWMKQS